MKRPEIPALAVFAALLLGLTPLAAIATTQQQVNTRESIIETRNTVDQSIENVEDDDESNIPGGYNIRWSTIGEVEGNDGVGVLVADCLPGEIPVMPVYDFVPNVGVTDQQVVGINDHLSLLLVVQNYDNDKQVLSMGVACFDPEGGEDDGEDGDTISIDNSIEITSIVKSIVKNINKNITVIGNGTGGNGSIVIPPPVNNGTDPGTIGNTTTPEITPPVGNTTETETPPQTPPIVENTTTTTPTEPTPEPEPEPTPEPEPEPTPEPEPGDDEGDGGGEPDATDEE